jgi:two-component system CheB/CheR fusion protein
MHGGTIVARSDGPGQGSEFIVRLPLAHATAAAPRQTGPGTLSVGRASRILVVDDSVDTARGMVRLLKLLGNEVITVHDGPAALEAAHTFRPDFVLLDIGLPGMNGYEVATALRRDPLLDRAVIIAVSGYGQDEDRRRSLAAGFHHHLVKPVDFESLVLLIGRPG